MLPSRYWVFAACIVLALLSLLLASVAEFWLWPALLFGALSLVGLWDLSQTRHAVRRNYPVIAHFRYLLESIGPEIRQYFIEADNDERPFSRQQRAIVYQRAKNVLDKRPFGTQMDVYGDDYPGARVCNGGKHEQPRPWLATLACWQPGTASAPAAG